MLIFISFVLMCFFALYVIIKRCARFNKYSNGYYQNSGQDIILWCSKTQDVLTKELNTRRLNDTLKYEFFLEEGVYYLRVYAILRLQKNTILPATFSIQFFERKGGTYIVASGCRGKIKQLAGNAFEPELYEFFVKKLGAVPCEKVT